MWLLREFGNKATLETFTVIQAGPVHDFIITSSSYTSHCIPAALFESGIEDDTLHENTSVDDVLLPLDETVSPRRGEALGHHQCERGVGVHAHIATLDVWADAWRHVTLEGFRELGQSG